MSGQIWDEIEPSVFTEAVRQLPAPPEFEALQAITPSVFETGVEVKWERLEEVNSTALYRPWNTPVRPSTPPTVVKSETRVPALGTSYPLDELGRLRVQQLQTGAGATGLRQRAFDFARFGRRQILNRMQLAVGTTLVTGAFTLTGEGGHEGISADFGTRAEETPSTAWTDAANSTPFADITAWRDQFRIDGTSGASRNPAIMLMNSTTQSLALLADEIRTMVTNSFAGTPSIITPAMLNQVLTAHGLPIVVIDDSIVRHQGVDTKTIPDDKIVFLPADTVCVRWWGVVPEALDLVEAGLMDFNEAAGIVSYVLVERNPTAYETIINAAGLPIITDKYAVLVADVG